MVTADQALRIVLDACGSIGIERVPIQDGLHRVLAEEVRSPRDIPGFDNSAMDGYAVRAADVAAASETHPISLKVVETVAAGRMPKLRVNPGECVRTMTGAPIADGADAVIPVERTRGSGNMVEFLASVEPSAFVRPRGEDLKSGDIALAAGKILGPADLGMLASVNRAMVAVYRRPRVAIVATGDELVGIDEAPSGAQVVNSSAYALYGAVREAGGDPVVLRVARDTKVEVRERLEEAMASDVILSTGGVSVGQFDFVKDVLDDLGMKTLFHGVAQKPGRPLKFGMAGALPIFGLPGNPVSTLVCFYLYVGSALRAMAGWRRPGLPRIQARCASDIRLSRELTDFVRVTLERRDDDYFAAPTGSQGSGILSSLSRADGLLIGPHALTKLARGDQATVLLLAAGASDEAFFEERRLQRN